MLLPSAILRFHAIAAYILFLLFAPVHGSGAKLDCEVLKSRIDEELKAKGIQSFRLSIVPSGAQLNAKPVGTCNGGTRKIIYTRGNDKQSAPIPPKTSESEVEKLRVHIDWAFNNKGAPCADCNPKDRPACCDTCSRGGLLPRDQIAAQAAIAAKKVGCEGAVGVLLETQCQNPDAAKLLALHKTEACELLRGH